MKESEALQDPEVSLVGGSTCSPQERWRREATGEGHVQVQPEVWVTQGFCAATHISFSLPLSVPPSPIAQGVNRLFEM